MKFVAQNRLIGEFAISQGSNCNAWTRIFIIIFYQQINWIVLILFNKSNHLLTAIEASVQTITFCQAHFNTIQPHSILCECGTGDNCRFCTHLRLLRNDFNFTQNIEIIDCERMTCRYTNLVCGKGAANWVIDWQNEFLIAFTPWKSSKPNHYSACLWSPNGVNEEFVMHSECYQPNESDATMSFVINDLKQIPEHSIGASPYIGEKKKLSHISTAIQFIKIPNWMSQCNTDISTTAYQSNDFTCFGVVVAVVHDRCVCKRINCVCATKYVEIHGVWASKKHQSKRTDENICKSVAQKLSTHQISPGTDIFGACCTMHIEFHIGTVHITHKAFTLMIS